MKHEFPRFRSPRTTSAGQATFPFVSLDDPLPRLRAELREPTLIPDELSWNNDATRISGNAMIVTVEDVPYTTIHASILL